MTIDFFQRPRYSGTNLPIASEVAPIAHVGAGGSEHALAVSAGAAGFLSGADKTKIDMTPTVFTLLSDVSNSANNTFANVTTFGFAVTSGTMTQFYITIAYTAAATTTGSRWSLTGPTLTRGAWSVTMPPASGAAPYTPVTTMQTAYDSGTVSTGTPTTDNNLVIIEGFVLPSANGTMIVRFASEVSGSAITAKAGSKIQYW